MKKTGLLIIDVQKGFNDPVWGKRNNPDAEANMALLLAEWRKQRLPVIHVKHCSVEPNSPLRPDRPGNAFKEEVQPLAGEKQFTKTVNSAFIGTGLDSYLKEQKIPSLVIVGLTTDHCVSTSVRMAANLGFDVTLVSDATATFDRIGQDGSHYTADEIQKINLVSLYGDFCHVRSAADVLKLCR